MDTEHLDADFLHEQAYLKQTQALIRRNLTELLAILDEEQENLHEARLELQENQPAFADDRDKQTETAQYLSGLQTQLSAYRAYADRLKKLNLLNDSPYFGRIDFAEADRDAETYYIGLASLRDPLTYQMQVCDWRSPLASLFYRAVPGEVSFMAPDGEITGRLLRKRQYEIERGELSYYFDTDFHIKDGILKKVLSQQTTAHMKAIVESLQDAQDRLIRQKSKVVLIQGAAGSGKTSLAMHRAAFLMYQDFQDSLNAREILIVSPNHLFSRYVSRVLPELGEENITSLTFDDIFSANMAWAEDGPAGGAQINRRDPDSLLAEEDRDRFLLLRDIHSFKQSTAFAAMLGRLADYYERRLIRLPDVYYHHRYISTSRELKEELLRDRGVLPLAKRLEQMRRRLSLKIHEQKKARLPALQVFVSEYPDHQLEIFPFARLLSMKRGAYLNRLLDNLPKLDIPGLYRRLWDKPLFYLMAKGLDLPSNIEDIRRASELGIDASRTGADVGAGLGIGTGTSRGAGTGTGTGTGRGASTGTDAALDASDLPGFMWLRLLLEGTTDHPQIRQVIVDEAQDYGPLHFMFLRKWFPKANFTVLGDVQQCLAQSKDISAFAAVAGALGEPDSPTAVLRASFRSTWEISDFCRRFLDAPDLLEPFQRHGQPVEILGASARSEAIRLLMETISRFRTGETGSIAVICKTGAQAGALYAATKGKSALQLVRDGSKADLSRSMIIPLHMVKGLEFDSVILWDVSVDNYGWHEQKRFLYLAASRALHRLAIVFIGRLSPLIQDDEDVPAASADF